MSHSRTKADRQTLKAYRPKSREEVRRNMSAIRSGENRTEVALRRSLHSLGLRYRKYAKQLPGHPDIVFSRSRVLVFVDGDYWHARELVEGRAVTLHARLSRLSEPSRMYWTSKFQHRVARDRQITRQLQRDGWKVIRLWESDVRADVNRAARRIARCVRRRSNAATRAQAARTASQSSKLINLRPST
ncbi:MAG: DNA mismatch endonuclease Vsr [Gemmatimonadaceae bacterium]